MIGVGCVDTLSHTSWNQIDSNGNVANLKAEICKNFCGVTVIAPASSGSSHYRSVGTNHVVRRYVLSLDRFTLLAPTASVSSPHRTSVAAHHVSVCKSCRWVILHAPAANKASSDHPIRPHAPCFQGVSLVVWVACHCNNLVLTTSPPSVGATRVFRRYVLLLGCAGYRSSGAPSHHCPRLPAPTMSQEVSFVNGWLWIPLQLARPHTIALYIGTNRLFRGYVSSWGSLACPTTSLLTHRRCPS